MFAERIPLPTAMTSSDAGASFHYNFPSNYGDIHVGVYNGENYQKVEVNNQKAFEFRGTVRPFATGMPVLRGLRAHLVYYNDHYASSDERMRMMGNVTFEHQYPERRVRLSGRQGPDPGDGHRRGESGLLDLGDAAIAEG